MTRAETIRDELTSIRRRLGGRLMIVDTPFNEAGWGFVNRPIVEGDPEGVESTPAVCVATLDERTRGLCDTDVDLVLFSIGEFFAYTIDEETPGFDLSTVEQARARQRLEDALPLGAGLLTRLFD